MAITTLGKPRMSSSQQPAPAPKALYTPTRQTEASARARGKRARDSIGELLLYSPQKRENVTHVEDIILREKVVEFLAVVCEDFGLKTTTAALAVTYYDRWMSTKDRKRFSSNEVIGLTCVFVAAKYDDTKVPYLSELCNVPPKAISRSELYEAEWNLVKCLGWRLYTVLPHAFLEQFILVFDLTIPVQKRCYFLTDMSYYESKVLKYSPCAVSLASVHCALKQLTCECTRVASACSQFSLDIEEVETCSSILEEHFNVVFGHANPSSSAIGSSSGNTSSSGTTENINFSPACDKQKG